MKKTIMLMSLCFVLSMMLSCSQDEPQHDDIYPDIFRIEQSLIDMFPEDYDSCILVAGQMPSLSARYVRVGDTVKIFIPSQTHKDGYISMAVTDSIVRCRKNQNHADAYKRLYNPEHSVIWAEAEYDENDMFKRLKSDIKNDTSFIFDNVRYEIKADSPWMINGVIEGRPTLKFHEFFFCHNKYISIKDFYFIMRD